MATLAIVQCGASKIWKKNRNAGSVPAEDAYVSGYFRNNRAYAERFADRWFILSAKYGFLDPGKRIRSYNVSFLKPRSRPISLAKLQAQVNARRLSRYRKVIVLGGALYADKVGGVFGSTKCRVYRPFDGLEGIGYIQHAVSRALRFGKPLPVK